MPTGFFFLVKPVDFTQPKNDREGKAMLAVIKSGFKKRLTYRICVFRRLV